MSEVDSSAKIMNEQRRAYGSPTAGAGNFAAGGVGIGARRGVSFLSTSSNDSDESFSFSMIEREQQSSTEIDSSTMEKLRHERQLRQQQRWSASSGLAPTVAMTEADLGSAEVVAMKIAVPAPLVMSKPHPPLPPLPPMTPPLRPILAINPLGSNPMTKTDGTSTPRTTMTAASTSSSTTLVIPNTDKPLPVKSEDLVSPLSAGSGERNTVAVFGLADLDAVEGALAIMPPRRPLPNEYEERANRSVWSTTTTGSTGKYLSKASEGMLISLYAAEPISIEPEPPTPTKVTKSGKKMTTPEDMI
jgi:hypothetical protein